MRCLKSMALAFGLMLSGPALAQETPPPVLSPAEQAEIAAAEANQADIATRPRWAEGPEVDYPEAERALGHHGAVRVRGLLGTDGRMRHAVVETSSRAPVLDANALAWVNASRFEPARNAAGEALPVMITVPVAFDSYRSSEGVGAAMYTCQQFVLDMDWYGQAFAEEGFREHDFYLMVRGLGFIARMGQTGDTRAALESNEAYLNRWMQAIAYCRAHPDRRFANAMHPEGDIIDGMARQRR
jgi:TonB family protein